MAGLLSWGWAAPPNPTASGATVRSQREGDQTRVAGESPGVCSLADPVSAHGPCQVRGWGSRHLFQARQTACASRVRELQTEEDDREGPGKEESTWAPVKRSHSPVQTWNRIVWSREQSGFQGRGERAATPHPWPWGTAGGRAGSSVSDSGRPRSPRVPAAGPDLDAGEPATRPCPTATARHASWGAVHPPGGLRSVALGLPGCPWRQGAGRGQRRAGNTRTEQ